MSLNCACLEPLSDVLCRRHCPSTKPQASEDRDRGSASPSISECASSCEGIWSPLGLRSEGSEGPAIRSPQLPGEPRSACAALAFLLASLRLRMLQVTDSTFTHLLPQ